MQNVYITRGLVRYKGRYLFLRKVRDVVEQNKGKWEAPGGKIKPGEEPRQAVRREVLEETKIPCKIIKEMETLRGKSDDVDCLCHVFLLEATTDEVTLSNEHDYYTWATPQEIKKMPLVLFAEMLIDKIFEAEEYYNKK